MQSCPRHYWKIGGGRETPDALSHGEGRGHGCGLPLVWGVDGAEKRTVFNVVNQFELSLR